MCLSRIAGEAKVIVLAATAFLIIAFVARGSGLTLGLTPLVAIAACFIIRMLDEHFRLFAEIVRSRFVIAEKQRVAEEAREAAMTIALTDDLTGLPNRRCFQSLLADRITAATETGEPFALGLIDLDSFKPINDVYGHPTGDEILRQVAGRLAKAMEERGSAVRMGGDEFAILCDRIGGRDEAVALGKEIQAIFATPFEMSPLGIRLTCACGLRSFLRPPPSRTSWCDWPTLRSTAPRLADRATRACSTQEPDAQPPSRTTFVARSTDRRALALLSTSRPKRRL